MGWRWPWSKQPKLLDIPPYNPDPPPPPRPVQIGDRQQPKTDGLIVEEHDTSQMTQTGVHRAWRRLTGQE